MKFRPCIDIHNGKVKQIVGGSLTDCQDQAVENFVSENLPFSTSLVSEKKNSTFMNVITLSSFDKDYHRVRVLLSPDKDYFVFFGYEDNYTIVTDTKDVNQEKNCYAGISITFHSSVKIESLYAYFQSEEKSFYFTLS